MTGSLDLGLAIGYWGAHPPPNLLGLATAADGTRDPGALRVVAEGLG
ncbi:MAG TPA: hypothetical protein VGA69_02460 [Nitriliruptorales bacterium]